MRKHSEERTPIRTRIFRTYAGRRMFGIRVQQTYANFALLEYLLDEHAKDIHWICEIGTGTGGGSLYFAAWACIYEIPFITFDIKWPNVRRSPKTVGPAIEALGGKIFAADVFEKEHSEFIKGFIGGNSGLLICDGGDKPREIATFAPFAYSGSIITAHDCPKEISLEHIGTIEEIDFYEPWHSESMDMGTTTIVTKRK